MIIIQSDKCDNRLNTVFVAAYRLRKDDSGYDILFKKLYVGASPEVAIFLGIGNVIAINIKTEQSEDIKICNSKAYNWWIDGKVNGQFDLSGDVLMKVQSAEEYIRNHSKVCSVKREELSELEQFYWMNELALADTVCPM